MSFRLRRGTDTERQAVVFAEGELVYTTDTQELYVGDGVTLGGIRITGNVDTSPIALSRNLDLNTFDIVGSGDIDINGFITATHFYGNGAGLTNIPALNVNDGAAYQISIVGADSSIIVNSNTSEIFGNFIGNFSGDASNLVNFPPDVGITVGANYRINIVGSDSSIMVDTQSSTLTGNISTNVVNTGSELNVTNVQDIGSELFLNLMSSDQQSNLRLERTSTSDITADELGYGRILFTKNDVNGRMSTSLISATRSYLFMGNDPAGTFPNSKFFSINDGKFGIGTFSGTEKLTVAGNTVVDGFVQFGSLTTTQRDALTAANGMVIYNTTNNKFEGRQNGVWINLDDGTPAT